MAADLRKDIAQKVEFWPKRGLQSSRVIGSETDALNKITRASFGEDRVACVQKRLSQRGGGELGVVAPENDVAALSFPKDLVDVGNGASDVLMVYGVRGSHDGPASRNVAEEFGLLRRHVLFRANIMLVIDGDRRRVPLGK